MMLQATAKMELLNASSRNPLLAARVPSSEHYPYQLESPEFPLETPKALKPLFSVPSEIYPYWHHLNQQLEELMMSPDPTKKPRSRMYAASLTLRRKVFGIGVYLRVFRAFKYSGYHSWITDNGDIYNSKRGQPTGKIGTLTKFRSIGIWVKKIERDEVDVTGISDDEDYPSQSAKLQESFKITDYFPVILP
jgi:hypothetical protein